MLQFSHLWNTSPASFTWSVVRITYKFKTRFFNLLIRLQHGHFLLPVLISSDRYTAMKRKHRKSNLELLFLSIFIYCISNTSFTALSPKVMAEQSVKLISLCLYYNSRDVMIYFKMAPSLHKLYWTCLLSTICHTKNSATLPVEYYPPFLNSGSTLLASIKI